MGHPFVQVIFKGTVVQSVPFEREALLIGRARDNDVVIDNLSVSRHHAKLFLRDGQVILEDQGSENGCLVNGRSVARAVITDEDEVFVGKHQIVLRAPEAEGVLEADEERPRAPARSASPWDDAHTYCVLDANPKPATREAPAPALREEPAGSPAAARAEAYAGLILQRAGKLERIVPVDGAAFVLGRAPECELVLDGAGVSRRHARIVREADRFLLEDLGSANGTLVNGTRTERCRLEVGDELRIDEFQLTFVLESRPLAEEIRLGEAERRGADREVAAERTLLAEVAEPGPTRGAEPVSGELFGRMEELTPTPPEPPGEASGRERRLILEVELDRAALPAALREALEAVAGEAGLRLPVTLRLRR
jgi:pSer/pThr/pTyr-binding forkhead associated (FHA) protein